MRHSTAPSGLWLDWDDRGCPLFLWRREAGRGSVRYRTFGPIPTPGVAQRWSLSGWNWGNKETADPARREMCSFNNSVLKIHCFRLLFQHLKTHNFHHLNLINTYSLWSKPLHVTTKQIHKLWLCWCSQLSWVHTQTNTTYPDMSLKVASRAVV